ncbi:MAG: AAA family ATPase [bacterium]
MKIAISGKGGSGKTTIAACLCQIYAKERRVLAVDCDPDPDLALALGIPKEEALKIKPLSSMKSLIEERVGKEGFFRLNPDVSDIIDKIAIKIGNIRLIVMGGVKKEGCFCPENRFLREIITRVLLEDSIVIMDMEPGIEHLCRQTAKGCDVLLIVVEPGIRSIKSAETIKELGLGLGIPHIMAIANKIRDNDLKIIKENFSLPICGKVSYNEALIFQDKSDGGVSLDIIDEVRLIKEEIEKFVC